MKIKEINNSGISNKFLVWVLVIVFAVIVISIVMIFVSREKQEKPDSASVQCSFFCETGQIAGFCSFEIIVNENLRTTCEELSKNSQYSQYNVQPCPAISCEPTLQESDKTCVTGLNSSWVAPTQSGECPIQENKSSRKRTPSDAPPLADQICCFYYE